MIKKPNYDLYKKKIKTKIMIIWNLQQIINYYKKHYNKSNKTNNKI